MSPSDGLRGEESRDSASDTASDSASDTAGDAAGAADTGAGTGPDARPLTGQDTGPVSDLAGGESARPAAATSRRKALLVSAAAVVVLVVAGVVIFLVNRGDDAPGSASPSVPAIEGSDAPTRPSPAPDGSTAPPATESSAAAPAPSDVGAAETLAEDVATAIANTDTTALSQLACDPNSVGADTFPADAKVEKVEVVGEPQIDGDTATIDIRLTIQDAEPATVPMPLVKQNGRWCLL